MCHHPPVLGPGHEPAAPGDTTTTTTPKVTSTTTIAATTTTTTTTVPHTSAPTSTATPAPVVPTSTSAPVKTTATPSGPPKSVSSSVLPTGPAPTNGTASTCMSTADCADGLLCQLAVSGSPTGVCGAMPARFFCKPNAPQVAQVCVTTSDCRNPAYSICRPDQDNTNRTVCVGLGDPTLSPCTQDAPNGDDGSITNTLKYAGIGVGSVAALAVVFALVRWQRRRQRSKMPENMFGEVDYGMTDRSTTKAEPYAFSSRTAAQGSENYEDSYYQGGAGGGGGGYNKDQYYDDQHYGHDGYGNGGGYGQGGHGGHNDGFYDNSGYDDYNQQPAAPARAMSPRGGDYQMDHYGVEPSEMGYGGHGHGHGGGGYDRY
ncbi:hypothetical protein BGZ59_003804 [Podila verticillata]|nr:hypothetical protein BGZ59_003804 [Podila verticillata]